MNRRDFVLGATAMASFGPSLTGLTNQTPSENLKVGILSDVHVTCDADAGVFEKALKRFDVERVDAVLIAGDLATRGHIKELEALARAWYKVFPNDKRSDHTHIVRLWVTGNHDVDAFAGHFDTLEEARKDGFYFHRQAVWRRLFNEDYLPITVKTVKGYLFVLRHWMSILGDEQGHRLAKGFGNERSPLPEILPKVNLPPNRPFFYVQHEPIDNTTNASWLIAGEKWANGQDKGATKAVLDAYPNCVALTGHCHNSLTDEKSIWQGEFTAVNCSCARGWAFTAPGRQNGFSISDFNRQPPMEMPRIDNINVRQAMIMTVSPSEIRFHRFELTYDQVLGPDWVVSLYNGSTIPPSGKPKYDFIARKDRSKPPQFMADSKISARRILNGRRRDRNGINPSAETCEQVMVEFPPITARSGSPSRAYDFTVRCELRNADFIRCVDERRVYSPNMMQAESRDVEPCTCAFPGEQIPRNRKVRFVITPFDCWGNGGNPIYSDWQIV